MERIKMSNRENDGSEQPPAHEAVGYRKPPMKRRFKKSGNLKGRPKGAKNRKTIVKAVANEMHSVLENGKHRKRSTLDLVLLRLRNMALEDKNVRAFEEFHRLIKAYQPQETNDRVGYLVVSAEMSPEEWVAEQMEKNKHRKRPSGCKP
jgi:hypothetical protein